MKKSILFTLILTLTLGSALHAKKEDGEKLRWGFTGISDIDLGTVSGECIVKSHKSDSVIVLITYNYKPMNSVRYVHEKSGSKLKLKEKMKGSNSGWSTWILIVPEQTNIKFGTASGNFTIEGVEGRFDIGSASGTFKIKDVIITGTSKFSTASGHVNVDHVTIQSKAEFSTASGNVNVKNSDILAKARFGTASGDVKAKNNLIKADADFGTASGDVVVNINSKPEGNIKAQSASGDATVDFNGIPVVGRIKMKARENKGEIKCPFEFDKEEVVKENNDNYMVKTVMRQSASPTIVITTASGKAVLKQ